MSQQNRNNQSPQSQPQQMTPEIVQAFLLNQQIEAQNEGNRLRLRERELDANAKFASESLKVNADYITKKPRQDRITFLTVSGIAAVFVLIILGFILYLIHLGEKDIAFTVLKGIGVIATNIVSFFAGRGQIAKSKNTNGDSTGAEVVE